MDVSKTVATTKINLPQKNTIQERLRDLLLNSFMSDVCFIVGVPSENIHAHSFILSMGSSVFFTMFHCSIPESKRIRVVDVKVDAFHVLLRFLYTNEMDFNGKNVISVLYAAKKYDVIHVTNACVEYIGNALDTANVCWLLEESIRFTEPDLTEKCLTFIDAHAELVFQSTHFLTLNLDTLQLIFRRDTLKLRSEMLVYNAAIAWAAAECERNGLPTTTRDKRFVLHDAFYQVRFPLISPDEFARGPAQEKELFTDQQLAEIFICQLSQKESSTFLKRSRAKIESQSCVLFQFNGADYYRYNSCGQSSKSSGFQFCADKPVIVSGVGLTVFQPSDGYVDEINVSMKLMNSNQVLDSNSRIIEPRREKDVILICFDSPEVHIEANKYYTIRIDIGCNVRCRVVENPTKMKVGNVTFQFKQDLQTKNYMIQKFLFYEL